MPELNEPRWPDAGIEPAGPPDHQPPAPLDEIEAAGIVIETPSPDLGQIGQLAADARDTCDQTALPPVHESAGEVLGIGQSPQRSDGEDDGPGALDAAFTAAYGPVVRPVNWIELPAQLAEQHWRALDNWIHWLRTDYGLPAAVIPPCWHLHPELVWELSALHSAWLHSYDPQANASGPIGWLAQFAGARDRLRAWVQTAGCKIDRHRTTRTATWPGEADRNDPAEYRIHDRETEFTDFVLYDVAQRQAYEQAEHDDVSVAAAETSQGPAS